MRTEPDGSWSNHWSLLPQRLADQYPELIHIEAQSLFYHFAASAKGLSMLFDDDRPIPPDVLSIHLWAHLWWSRRRTDFSLFHEGRLTEQFIREVDTTFNRAARPFLPSISPTKRDAAAPMACRWKAAASDRIDAAGDDMRALAGLAVFPVIRTISPGFGRLHLARAHWIYRRAQRRFRPLRGPLEPAILRWVIQFDEYGVFHRRFEPGDVVLDIGAHLGSFSFACHAMGCRKIHAFEPLAEDFTRLTKHLQDVPGIRLYAQAIFRSDRSVGHLLHSGPYFANSGGGNVLFGGRLYDVETDEFAEQSPENAQLRRSNFPGRGSEPVSTSAADEDRLRRERVPDPAHQQAPDESRPHCWGIS